MSQPAELDPVALRSALDDLVVRGAEVWDAPAVALIRTLLAKAEGLEGVAATHLVKRAGARFEKLSADFERARERAGETYAQLVRQGLDPAKRLDSALQYGRFDEVARAAKRHDEARVAAREAIVQPWLERLTHEAHARGLSQPPPAPSDSPTPLERPERETVTGLAAAIYQDAAADATARLVVAHATAELPAHAGRYHAPSVAARALQALDELAPAYLRVQVARLEAIGALQRWVTPPPPPRPERARASAAKPSKAAKPKAAPRPRKPKKDGKGEAGERESSIETDEAAE